MESMIGNWEGNEMDKKGCTDVKVMKKKQK